MVPKHLCSPADLVFDVAAKIEDKLRAVGLSFRDWVVVRGPLAPNRQANVDLAFGAMGGPSRVRVPHRSVDPGSPARSDPGPGDAEEGLKLAGGPFGNASFAEDYVRRTAEEHERQLQALVEFGQHFPQYAYLMLKYCATFRIHYLYALVPWDIAGDTYTRAHDCILSTFRRIVELPDASEDVSDYVRDRLSLPHRDGGFALVNPKHVANNALVANWCACAAFLAKAVPSLRHIGGPPPVRRACLSLEWASLVARFYETINDD